MSSRSLPTFASSLLLLALAACSGSGGGAPPPAVPPPAAPPPPPPVTQTIGPAGGTINGPLGVSITIPPDALGADTSITVAVDSTGAPPLPSGGRAIGPLISLTPHGTTFGVPITLSMPFDTAQIPAGANITLLKTNAAGDSWQQLVTERSGDTLTAAATSFSNIGVYCCIDLIRIVDQPDDLTLVEGDSAFFRVHALTYGDTTYQWFRNGLALPGETNPEILVPRVRYDDDDNSLWSVRISAFGAAENSRAARLLVTPRAPVIINQPMDTQVVDPGPAQFFAASTSSVPQTLLWERLGVGPVSNATTPTLSINAPLGDNGAQFRLCATNVAGTSCSRYALLSVIPAPAAPTISQQPQPEFVAAGSSATFTAIAAGGGLAFEWHRADDGGDFSPITGATSASYTISNAQLADDGAQFRVRVFNSVGTALSSPALLTVLPNPGGLPTRVGGGRHSVGLRGDGTLRAWGVNTNGQLGDGTFDERNDVVDVIGLRDVATMSVGYGHTLAIRTNGEVWSWGRNQDGELGNGTTTDRAVAQPVPGLAAARAVSASATIVASFSLAVLADGSVRAWGSNLAGRLGDGTVTNRTLPVQVGSLSEVATVSAGSRHSLALRRDGSVWAWGANYAGQLGNGTWTASLTPIAIPMPAPIVAIAAGSDYSLALTDAGEVLAWGQNVNGSLGDGTTQSRTTPIVVPLPAPAIAIAAAWGGHSLALLADGRVYAWGANTYGQCGTGTASDRELLPQAVIAPLPANIVAIGGGARHSLALDVDGNVWAWGDDRDGQLNDGIAGIQSETPVPVRNVNLN
jgi:alpha-tubulin suppressor-like RCC1 family protein